MCEYEKVKSWLCDEESRFIYHQYGNCSRKNCGNVYEPFGSGTLAEGDI